MNGSNKNKRKSNNTTTKGKKTGGPAPRKRAGGSTGAAMAAAEKWKRLILHPCSADLASPPYSGSDSGYLMRTVNNYAPAVGLVAAGTTFVDFSFTYTPWNLSLTTGVQTGGGAVGAGYTMQGEGFATDFICNSQTVREYRPVAACVKWIPTGPVGQRGGLVSLGYASGLPFITGAATTSSALKTAAQHNATNGTENHEVNWLPTAVDELFTTVSSPNQAGAGCCFVGLSGVDCVTTGTVGNYTARLQGWIEVTTVWEWIPSAYGGVSIPLKSPSPYSTQQILSTFPSMADAVLAGVYRGMQAMGAANRLWNAANGFLRSGLPYSSTRQQLLTY